ncbi:MAG: hypothetical protein V3V33_15105 [Candidatus Lokiarchaeia archaeon]
MENKNIIIGAIALIIGLGVSTGTLTGLYVSESDKYNKLTGDCNDLLEEYGELYGNYDTLLGNYSTLLYDFNELDNQYFILTGKHIELENDYNTLLGNYNILEEDFNNLTADYSNLNDTYHVLLSSYDELNYNYNILQIAYDYITDTIRQSILPVQYSIFAEAVRRYYMDVYLEGLSGKEYWMAFAEFCRDIILHDSWQKNSFIDVSNAFSDALKFGNDTEYLAHEIMYNTLWDWLPNWYGWGLTGNELTDINMIVDWCIDEIDYEYDSDITLWQEYFNWDYIKFPVETAFRTFGDCEDQAILCAAYLESCGFETAIAIFHDPAHPTYGEFYHGVPIVHIEDVDAFYSIYGFGGLWHLGGIDPYYPDFTWYFLDPTWNIPFGTEPSWLDDYKGGNMTWDKVSIAICDIDGVVGENIGLTYVIPT